MKFHAQTTLVALAILCTALLLSSFLSLAAFEKIYAAALISTSEVAAKSLQQKIETALRFGKPLGRFTGMDRLLVDGLEFSPEITGAGVTDRDGWILYHTDPARVGQRLPCPPFLDASFAAGATRRSGEVYITTMPLRRRAHDPVGVLHITFTRSPLQGRLKDMALQTLDDLVPLLSGAALLLTALLLFGLTRPLNRRLLRLCGWLETLGRPGWEAPPGYPDAEEARSAVHRRLPRYEPDQLAVCLAHFARHANRTLAKAAALQAEVEALEARLAALEGRRHPAPGDGAGTPSGKRTRGESSAGTQRKAP
jgi:hypothetical protein